MDELPDFFISQTGAIMYVLKRMDQGGGYVSKPGSRSSYTRNVAQAQKYSTREEAEGNRCVENEIIVPLEGILEGYRQ